MTFDTFSFDPRIVAGIKACGYVSPTPIQERAIPDVLSGRDVLGLAQTGTGKTAAFALPILQRLASTDARRQGPIRTLVLAPTRELALQIHESFVALGKQTGIRSAAVFGGVGLNPQIKAARRATVAVACPGRLLDLLNQRAIDLNSVDTLVLDEADRMLDMGFLPDIRRILSRLPAQRQNLLFSATMPRDIRHLADEILVDPITVQVEKPAPAKSVSHAFYPVRQHLKTSLLQALLDATEHESVLIFTRTKHRAKSLAQKLDKCGHQATFLQGNMSQNQRQRSLEGFRNGTFDVMVATDIAARGIDCNRITHVINFDVPDTAETYTHRIGRTGRAGRSGSALSLVTDDDRPILRAIQRLVKKPIDSVRLEGFEYNRAAAEMADRAGRRVNTREADRRAAAEGRSGRKPANGRRSADSREAGSKREDRDGNRPNRHRDTTSPSRRRKRRARTNARHGEAAAQTR